MLRTKKEVDRHVRELLNKLKNENDRKTRGYNISRLYFNVGEYESARRYLGEFISLRPKSPDAHKLMGQIYEKLGQKDKAVASYKTSYSISDTQNDLVPKICELYAELDVDVAVRTYWAEEGERLFPHHNSVVKLRQNMMLSNPSQSKEEVEKFYLKEIKANPLSLSLHVKLAKLFLDWGKEESGKYDEAFNYVIRVEGRRPFPHSLEWYQTMVEVFKAYKKWKEPRQDKKFEESYLSILDRYVFESLASSCGPALSAHCSIEEAAQRLKNFDSHLVQSLKIVGIDSACGRHMVAQYFFHLALAICISGKTESILHKDIYVGCLLLHACVFPVKSPSGVPSALNKMAGDGEEVIKAQWFSLGHYRVSQAGHMLNQLAHAYRGHKHYLNKIQETCTNKNTQKHIYNLVFEGCSSAEETCNQNLESVLLSDVFFMKGDLAFVEHKVQHLADQDVSLLCSNDLRELVWLYTQYNSPTPSPTSAGEKTFSKFFNFTFFRNIPFASSMNTFAPETLCHLDLVAFVVATAFCHQANSDVYGEVSTACPSILSVHLHTPEQGEWWNAAGALCSNAGSKRLNRLRSILQNGLESIRHLGHHVLPLHLTLHLARYFTTCISDAREEGNSATEIESLEERAEHYWSKVVAQCLKSAKGTLGTTPKSRLFEVRRCPLSESDLSEIAEEGEMFLADRLSAKGKRDEAIQVLARLKGPKAAFNRAMLYKKEAQSLLGNRTWHSLNLNARNEYTSLLTQGRDALYLTLDRLKMPGMDSSDPLNIELSNELTAIEYSLATVTLDDQSDGQSDNDEESGLLDTSRAHFNPNLELTNGNSSHTNNWGSQHHFNVSNNVYRTPTSTPRSMQRQEARPSPERLDAQVRHLTDIQQNTIKNIEEHNAALRAQNEALLQTCQTMSSEFKENVAFYKSYIEQKNQGSDHLISPVMEQLKDMQAAMRNLQIEVRTLSSEITEMRNAKPPPPPPIKPEPIQVVPGTSSADNQGTFEIQSPAVQGVYNNYMGFYGQQTVGSPLIPPTVMFTSSQPPFMPPSTLQDQMAYLPAPTTAIKSENNAAPTVLSATSLYQQPTMSFKVQGVKSSKDGSGASAPPHSYQISLPATSAINASVSQTPLASSSDTVFNTEGLLSNVPAPLYSAISSYQSPEKGTSKNLLVSSLTSTPATQSSTGYGSTPIFGQWPSSSANFPSGTPPVSTHAPMTDCKPSQPLPIKSVNNGDHYVDDGHDPCPDFKPIIPLPEQVEAYTGEEEEKVLFEGRAKLFRFHEKEWKERGLGPLKVLHNEAKGTARVLMRREQTHKICSNHSITASMELTTMQESDKAWVWAAQDFADEKLTCEKFCCKFKTGEVAQEFQKAFYKGKMIAEETEDRKKESSPESAPCTPEVRPGNSKPLSELFKPELGAWSCGTCLVSNKKDVTACAACQTPKPGAPGTFETGCSTPEGAKVSAFKFGFLPSREASTSPANLTFLGDKTVTPSALAFGATPVAPSKFGTPTGAGTPPSALTSTPIFGNSNSPLVFGPSSSVTLSALKPGSAPCVSLFKTTATTTTTSPSLPATTTDPVVIVTPTKPAGGGKFSVEGFTFSTVPSIVPAKPKEEGVPSNTPSSATSSVTSAATPVITELFEKTDQQAPKKESIFSNFTFSASTKAPSSTAGVKGMFSFSLPTTAVSAATSASTSPAVSSSTGGGLFSGVSNSGNVLTFGSVAATSGEAAPEQSVFTTKDTKAFQAKPLFAKSSDESQQAKGESSGAAAETSKDDLEDYEPQVDFKPVIPLPDLVDVKTGEEEEEKLLCERAKLFRFEGATKEWKERGVGEVKLLKNNSTNKVRLLMRRDQTHKVCANHLVTPDMTLTAMANSDKAWLWAANDYADEDVKVEKFAIRFKTSELANKFKTVFEEAQKLVPTAAKTEDPAASATPPAAPSATTSKPSETKAQSLSDMFKPAAGSWECTTCLVANDGSSTTCVACSTPKEGGAPGSGGPIGLSTTSSTFPTASSGFGGTPFPFKASQPSAAFTFGAPSSSSTPSVQSVPATSTAISSTFSFGFSGTGTTVTPLKATVSATTANTTATTSIQQPFSFTWKAGQSSETSTQASSTPSNTASGSIPATTPVKSGSDGSKGFAFGSPGKYQFSFSGVRSPRSRDTSTCESENGVEEEEEEEQDNLYFEPVVPLPDKVNVVTGEESEVELYCHRAKLYRLRDGEYKDRGIGDVKILEHKQSGKIRLLMRREAVHKVCLNHYLDAETEFRRKDDKALCWIATDHSEADPTRDTFAIRFKTPEIATEFAGALRDAQAKLGSSPSKTAPGNESLPSILEEEGAKSKGSADVEVVFEKTASPAQVARARKLLLPDNFFLYEDKEPCPGCIGCSPDELVFKKLPVKSVNPARKNLFESVTKASTTPSTPPQSGSMFDKVFSAVQPSKPFESVFGGKSSFNTPSPSAGSVFGGNSPAFPSIFGGAKQSPSIFGGTPTTATSTTTATKPSIFDSQPGSQPIFGSQSTGSPSIFGGQPGGSQPVFGQATGTGSIFGRPSTATQPIFGQSTGSTSIFGGQPAASSPIFSSQTTGSPSIFGGTPPAASTPVFVDKPKTSSAFGTDKPTGSIFDTPPSATPTFGASSQPSTVFDGLTAASKDQESSSEKETSEGEQQTICGKLEKGALSFGDLAEQADQLAFDQLAKSNSWAWVSKPLFGAGGADKTPNKDDSAEAGGDEDYDPHYEPVIPMPDLVKVTTGEEGWTDLFSSRAKVYRFDVANKEWKERGIGDFKIQHEPLIQKYRLLQRREQVHKLSCNHYLTPSLKLDPMLSSEVAWCWLAVDFSENPAGEHMKLAVKFKTKEIATDFKTKMESYQSAMSLSAAAASSDNTDVSSTTVTTSFLDIKYFIPLIVNKSFAFKLQSSVLAVSPMGAKTKKLPHLFIYSLSLFLKWYKTMNQEKRFNNHKLKLKTFINYK